MIKYFSPYSILSRFFCLKREEKKHTQNNPEALRALNPLSTNSVNTAVEGFLNKAKITKVGHKDRNNSSCLP